MRGLSRLPSGPLSPGDALDAGRVDARRLLKPLLLATSYYGCLVTPSLTGAAGAPDTGAPHAGSTHARSSRPPSPVHRAATACLSPWVVYPTTAANDFAPKPGKMPPTQPVLEGARPWSHTCFTNQWC